MAIKKLKLSKSLVARAAAIMVLIGMGGFAVWQSRTKQDDSTEGDPNPTLVAAVDSAGGSDTDASGGENSDQNQSAKDVVREKDLQVRTPPPLPTPSTFGSSSTSPTSTGASIKPRGVPSIPAVTQNQPQGNLGQLLQKEDEESSDADEETSAAVASAATAAGGFGGFKPPDSSIQNETSPLVAQESVTNREAPALPPARPSSSGGSFGGGTFGQASSTSAVPPAPSGIPRPEPSEPREAAPGLLGGSSTETDTNTDSNTAPSPLASGFSSTDEVEPTAAGTTLAGGVESEDTASQDRNDEPDSGATASGFGGARPLPGGLTRPPVGLGAAVGVGTAVGLAADAVSQDRANADESTEQEPSTAPRTLPQPPSAIGASVETSQPAAPSSLSGSNFSPTQGSSGNTVQTPRPDVVPPTPVENTIDQGPPASLGVPSGVNQGGASTGAGTFAPSSTTGSRPRPAAVPPSSGIGQPAGPPPSVPAPTGTTNSRLSSNSRPLDNTSGGGRYSSNVGPSPAAEHLKLKDHSLGLPGEAALEGIQTPALVIEKRAPAEIQRGKSTLFQFVVKNVGGSTATDVRVFDRIPQGAKLISAKPDPKQEGDQLIWEIGEVRPGEEVVLETTIVPEKTGELGSVAQVTFTSKATTRTLVTEPKLTITQTTPPVVMINDEINVQIRIENAGTGAAEEVTIETDIGDHVAHPAGSELRYEVGRLDPGDHQDLTLTLTAKKAGKIQQRLLVQGSGTSVVEDVAEFEIIAPQLALKTTGPSLRYLDRKAIHKIDLDNTGTADAMNVALVAVLSPGLKFISADRNGSYDARTHSVYWSLESMPKGQGDTVRLTTVPTQIGEAAIDYRLQADLVSETVDRQKMEVRELAELFFEIDDEVDPIEIGSETIYHVTVTNQGSKEATNVKMRMIFPPGIQVTEDIQSPVDYQLQAGTIVFENLDRIAPDQKIQIAVRAEGKQAGDQRVAFELSSDERPDWVRKEESTRVYADR